MITTEPLESDFLFPYFVPRPGKTVEANLNYQIWATIATKILPTHKIKVQPLVFPND